MPAIVLTIIGLLQAAANSENVANVKKVYENARRLFAMLFAGGIITSAVQKELMDWSEEHEAAVLSGKIPPEFTVEPDPA